MALGEAVIVAGFGSRKGVSADQVTAALKVALLQAALEESAVDLFAVPARKAYEPGLVEAAHRLGRRLVSVSEHDLKAAAPRTLSRSQLVLDLLGVPSAAEAAALAAAGHEAHLLGPRVAVGPVTCALAAKEPA